MERSAFSHSTLSLIYPDEPADFHAEKGREQIFEKSPKRLSKILAHLGVASRRQCEEMIHAGRIAIDDAIARDLFAPFEPNEMSLRVDGKVWKSQSQRAYFLFNKPTRCLCTASGSSSKVTDYFRDLPHRFFTVGRLDKETSGLIIVTNDGEFAHRIMHPRFGIPKEYEVVASQKITSHHLQLLEKGALLDGTWTCPLSVQNIDPKTVRICIGEGKNREIRRLMRACGLDVDRLIRLRIGHLMLKDLPIGHRKAMSQQERSLAAIPDPLLLKRSEAIALARAVGPKTQKELDR